MAEIKLEKITKSFRENTVLTGASFLFEDGKTYGIVGPNGCGKSVLFKIISGLMKPNSGIVTVGNRKIGVNGVMPEKMGILIESPGFIPELTGRENLEVLASIRREISESQIYAMIDTVGLTKAAKTQVKKYSLGMVQRLGIAQALMENPEVLLLDEPFNSVDQEGVSLMRRIIKDYTYSHKVTTILSSHNSDDVEFLCDEIVQLKDGKLVV